MNKYLQSAISTVIIFVGVAIILFYTFFEKGDDSNRDLRANQNISELRMTDFSQTTKIFHYIYICSIAIFLMMIYFLVPQQKLT